MEGLSITPYMKRSDGSSTPQNDEYDIRIDDYNWYFFFFVSLLFYFAIHALARKYAPSPGDIKVFKEKKRLKDYNFYYF